MRRFLIAAATAALLTGPALAQAPSGEYVVDKPHASLTWTILHQGLSNYTARFTSFDAALTFNEADVSKSKLTVAIDPKTVETDYAKQRPAGNTTDFNKELSEEANFFNSGKHKGISFVSKSVAKTGDKKGTVTGDLTFLGVTKPVTLDVTYVGNRNDPRANKHKLGFSATGKIKRSDFGMTFGQAFLGDEVKLMIEAEFVQK
ncbi:MAG: YceI family protein [Alphaproteobacteria bacterium]|nr:YceI family protein [Alphaproteobacteria bacterium]